MLSKGLPVHSQFSIPVFDCDLLEPRLLNIDIDSITLLSKQGN